MIINCEECGKRYQLDNSLIAADAVRFQCKVCGFIMRITKYRPPPTSAATDQTTQARQTVGSPQSSDKSNEHVHGIINSRRLSLSLDKCLVVFFLLAMLAIGAELAFFYVKYEFGILNLWPLPIVVIGTLLCICAGFYYWIFMTVISPVRKLTLQADRMTQGDMTAHVELKAAATEIRALGHSIDRMRHSLDNRIDTAPK
jgi:HAMP domain-containing protein